MQPNNKKIIISIVLAFLAGGALVFAVDNKDTITETLGVTTGHEVRENDSKYQFIKPLLSTEGDTEDLKWFPVERKLKADLQTEIAKYPDVKVGMHYINLTNSGWFGINGSESFIPASLLKLPLYTSYLKLREEGKVNFNETIRYEGTDYDKVQNLGTGNVKPGNTYTIDQLLTAMIVESDNNALELLYQYKTDSLKEVFSDLQLELPTSREDIATNDFVTPRGIARFLSVLYNSSYLYREDSEEALQLLSKTNFKDGLVAGLPEGTRISHKFGERVVEGSGGFKELHDCGIIYNEKNPYLLCVMTKGNDFDKQKQVIKAISEITYNHINTFAVSSRK